MCAKMCNNVFLIDKNAFQKEAKRQKVFQNEAKSKTRCKKWQKPTKCKNVQQKEFKNQKHVAKRG